MSVELAPTPKDTILSEGTARLYRFRRPDTRPVGTGRRPVLVVPSLINRWYILDLRAGYSVVEALNARYDTYLLDWGVPEDEDRYETWDRVLKKLGRAVRKVLRETGASQVTLLGYCMGATLSGIYTALHPNQIGAFINLAGPFDFSEGGMLSTLVDPRWFDVEAIVGAGNLAATQMQSGFTALRPTLPVGKFVNFLWKMHDEAAMDAFSALEAWSSDNTPFPAAAYKTYIEELYQKNALVKGEHWALGRQVRLQDITCPVLNIVASKDNICPPPAAQGLVDNVGTEDTTVLTVPGGHVGAVVGSRASRELYPKMLDWIDAKSRPPKASPLPPSPPMAQA